MKAADFPNAPSGALKRRIKRHITSQPHTFFAVTAPGIEKPCLQELIDLQMPAHKFALKHGGVEFQAPLHQAYAANLHLRTANRVLLRLKQFRAENPRRLIRQTESIDWELLIPPGESLQLRISCRHCRLHHTGMIADAIYQAVGQRMTAAPSNGLGPPTATSPLLVVRGVNDRFTLSLDSSGAPLYKRGIKPSGSPAPLRETMAAAGLLSTGFAGQRPLFDPMCGNGTFSLEAAMIAARIPPGYQRSFAFEKWPSFQPGRWRHLLRRADEQMRPVPKSAILAADLDVQRCQDLAAAAAGHAWSQKISVACSNFFDCRPAGTMAAPGWITLNPPYGHRLGDNRWARRQYRRMYRHLQNHFSGWQMILMVPAGLPLPPFACRQLRLSHGGLPVTMALGVVGTGPSALKKRHRS